MPICATCMQPELHILCAFTNMFSDGRQQAMHKDVAISYGKNGENSESMACQYEQVTDRVLQSTRDCMLPGNREGGKGLRNAVQEVAVMRYYKRCAWTEHHVGLSMQSKLCALQAILRYRQYSRIS